MFRYNDEDKIWFKDLIARLKAMNKFNFLGLREIDALRMYRERFKKDISIEGVMTLLQRLDNPEKTREYQRKYAESVKLRKQGLLPATTRQKSDNLQDTAELLSKYPFIIVINGRICGYETLDEAREAIAAIGATSDSLKLFEVKERKIKSQFIVDIE